MSECPAGYQADPRNPQYRCRLVSAQPPGQDPGRRKGAPRCGVGNPCDPATGNKFEQETDYEGAGPFPLRLVRSYNSAGSEFADAGPLGLSWQSNLHAHVAPLTGTASGESWAAVRYSDGAQWLYPRREAQFASDPDGTDRLERLTDGWLLRDGDGGAVRFDFAGRVASVTDRAGLVQTYTYDSAGRLLRVSDPFGRALEFGYAGASSLITTVTAPGGLVFRYEYATAPTSGRSLLGRVIYPDGRSRRYEYGGPYDALSAIIDQNDSRYAAFGYRVVTRPSSLPHAMATLTQHLADGTSAVEQHELDYVDAATVRVTGPLGAVTTYGLTTSFGVARITSLEQTCPTCPGGTRRAAWTFDANGNLASAVDFTGSLTCLTHDLARNLEARRVEGLSGAACPGSATPGVTRTVETDWDARFRLPVRETVSDSTGAILRATETQYDDRGNLTLRRDLASASTRTRTYLNQYSSPISGRFEKGALLRVEVDGPRNDMADVTTYDYYGPDEACAASLTDGSTTGCRGRPSKITNPLGHETRLTRYNAHGQPEEIVDGNGLKTTLAYDARQRMVSRTAGTEITGFTYDAAGQLTRLTLPDGSYLDFQHDGAHRLTAVADSLGNRVAYTLDAAGNRVREDIFDPSGQLAATRARVYDGLNRITQIVGGADPAAQVTRYDYDAQDRPTRIVDPLNRTTSQAYDALSRVVSIVDPAQGRRQLAYDALDQLTAVTDPRGLTTAYSPNGLGDLEAQVSPDTGTSAATYDAAGNVLTRTDARGVVTSYTYDALNRVTQVTFTPPAGSSLSAISHTFEYDHGLNAIGRLTRLSDPTGSTRYTYDSHGRVVQDTRVIHGVTYTTAYEYDGAGRLARTTYPSGRTVDYGYDSAGRVHQIDTTYANLTQPVVSGIAYHPLGSVSRFLFGNATRYERSFDLDGRVTRHTLGATTRTLGYDAASRLTAFAHPDPALSQAFGYDSLDRLTSWVAPNTSQGYTYDANGNRASATYGAQTYGYGYATTSNRLTDVVGPTPLRYTYDAAGSPTSDGVRSFVHDARGRLAQVSAGSTTEYYGINSLGQRVSKRNSAESVIYHYDAAGRLIAESAATGRVLKEYVWLGGLPVAMIDVDADADAVADIDDNCLASANPGQQDADGDGYGNACDADMNNDLFVNALDLGLLRQAFGRQAGQPGFIPAADFNSDGIVNALDLGLFRALFGKPPGPSGPRNQAQAPALYAIHPDHLNTPRVLADASGRVVWRWSETDPFGAQVPDSDPDGDGKRVTLNLRFPGQYFDRETGLHYNYFRDYDPQTGRYIQSDPIGLAGGINTYAYVEQDPVSSVDPLGLNKNRVSLPPGEAGGRYGPQLQAELLLSEIWRYDPGFRYDAIGPRGSRRTSGDVAYLIRVLDGYRTFKPRVHAVCTRENPQGGVYVLRDPSSDEVLYVGRSLDLLRRQSEYTRSEWRDLIFDAPPNLRTDSYSQQRGLEHLLFEIHAPSLNQIRPISPRNTRGDFYIETGCCLAP